MEFITKTVYGGAESPPPYLARTIRTIRETLKNSFRDIEIVGLTEINICLCLSGDVTRYYETSAIYNFRYFSQRGKIVATIHLDSAQWTGIEGSDTITFLREYRKCLYDMADMMDKTMKKYKLDFARNVYIGAVESAFG